MNLVAKEFAASRVDEDGVLILSEFTGAAVELTDALRCNPFDMDGLARTIEGALQLDEDERRRRIARMARAVAHHDVHRWTEQELAVVEETRTAA